MKDSGLVNVVEKGVVLGNLQHDSEATIPGFALQQHFSALTDFLSHKSTSLRYATLLLVGTLLRQGMVCPLEVLAPLIAMQGDCDASIQYEALTMLQTEDEKHPTFISNRMVDGIELCYSYQMRALGSATTFEITNNNNNNSSDVKRSVFSGFYSTCIQHPKRRREFLE